VKMDPRVKVTSEVQQIFTATATAEARARTAAAAYKEARAMAEKAKSDTLRKELDAIAPVQAPQETGGGRGGRGGGGGGFGGFGAAEPAGPADLSNIGTRLVTAVMPMQAAEMPPTASMLDAWRQQDAAYTALMAKWVALKAKIAGPPPAKTQP